MPVILATREGRDQEDPSSKPARENSLQDPSSKIFNAKKKKYTQVVEQLPSKHEALGSNPGTAKKIDKTKSQ
jgi:hypothetical protein